MKEDLEREVEKVIASLKGADVDWLSQHYAPEVTRFHQRGQLDVGWNEDKANEFRNSLNAGGVKFSLSEVELVDVRIYGEPGITAGHFHSKLKLPDRTTIGGPARFTYVWTRTNAGRKEIHHHISDLRERGQ